MVRLLSGPLSLGIVQEACTELFHQCSFVGSLQLQPAHWACSSSSSNIQQQHSVQFQQQRGKHTVRMVLLKDHEHLGSKGDIVEVKPGHARHTLFPKGEADYAVPSVIKQLKERGLLSAQALQQLQPGAKKQAARGPVDPATLPLEQQLPQIIQLLNSKELVVSRRFSWREPDQPMLGVVTAHQLCLYAAKQLRVELPRELVMMDDAAPITQYGSYKVPLNLKDGQGQQVELAVQVNKTYRSPGLRRIKLWAQEEGLMPQEQPRQQRQQQQQPQQQSPGSDTPPPQPEPQQQPSA